MESLNKPKIAPRYSFDVLISLVVLVATLLVFINASEDISGVADVRLGFYKFFMLAVVCVSFIILIIRGARINRDNLFLWCAVLYAFAAIFTTFASGLYPIKELPYRFVRISYWVCVLIISYYSVLHLNTFKFHIAIVYMFLPILFYFFYFMMKAGWGGMTALNPIFYISFLLPAILLVRSKILKIGGILLIFAAILISYKRSAMLALAVSIPVYFYAHIIISKSDRFKKLIPIIVGGTLVLLTLGFSFNIISNAIGLDWGGRLQNVVSGGGSGRIDIYTGYFGLLGSQSAYHWIMGHGHLATQYTSYSWAHNDVLEVLYDFGLVGLTFYLLFVGQLAKIFFDMKRCKYRHFDAFAVSLVIFFCGSMLSMLIILPYWFLNLAFFWGWVIADFHNAKRYGDPEKIGNPLYADDTEYIYVDD